MLAQVPARDLKCASFHQSKALQSACVAASPSGAAGAAEPVGLNGTYHWKGSAIASQAFITACSKQASDFLPSQG